MPFLILCAYSVPPSVWRLITAHIEYNLFGCGGAEYHQHEDWQTQHDNSLDRSANSAVFIRKT